LNERKSGLNGKRLERGKAIVTPAFKGGTLLPSERPGGNPGKKCRDKKGIGEGRPRGGRG